MVVDKCHSVQLALEADCLTKIRYELEMPLNAFDCISYRAGDPSMPCKIMMKSIDLCSCRRTS